MHFMREEASRHDSISGLADYIWEYFWAHAMRYGKLVNFGIWAWLYLDGFFNDSWIGHAVYLDVWN